jgi:hypothetical protein
VAPAVPVWRCPNRSVPQRDSQVRYVSNSRPIGPITCPLYLFRQKLAQLKITYD